MFRKKESEKSAGFVSLMTFAVMIMTLLFCSMSVAIAGGKKPEVIRHAHIMDLSGPYAPIVGALAPGTFDAWEYLNNELNGVHGVKVETVMLDCKGKTNLGLSMYNNLLSMDPRPLVVWPFSSGFAASLRERFNEDGFIGTVPTANDAVYPVANSFGIYPLYVNGTAAGLKYLKDNWKGKEKLRVGIITWDSSYGKAILTDEFFEYAKKIGIEIVGSEVFGMREVDVTNQLLRLRAKKANWLVTNSTGSGPVTIKKGTKEMGWKVNMLNNAGGDWGTVNLAPQLFDGDISALSVRSWDEDHPSIKKLTEYFKKNNRTPKDRTIFYIIGWQVALTNHAAFVAAVDKYGWDGLNSENLTEAYYQMKDFRPLGGLANVTYSKDRPEPRTVRMYKIEKGKFLPVSDFIEVPDLRPDKYK